MSKKFRLTGLEVVEGTICDEPMNPEAKVVLFKRRPARKEDNMSKRKKTHKNAPEPVENQDHLKALQEKLGLTDEQLEVIAEEIEAARKAAEEEAEKAAQTAAPELIGKEDDEDKEAADDEEKEARKSRSISKAEREIAELRKQLAAERDAREERDFLEKARSFDAIPVKRDKLAGLMRAVSTLEKRHGETLDQVLRACTALAKAETTITKSIGKANGLENGGRSAAEEIDEVAASLMKADPQLSKSEAIGKAWNSRPDLVAKSRKETGSR